MRALVWEGRYDVQVQTVPDPIIQEPTDIIIKVTKTAICGSDLHLLDSYVVEMEKGDILGHEFMGEVVEVGAAVTKFNIGDRVVVPFTISCGSCFFCNKQLYAACETTNPDHEKASEMMGHAPAGLFGYSHLTGGYAGGQAEYVRVPHADVGPIKVPDGLSDEQVLFLSDIYPTAWMAAENAGIEPGDTVAVWGCGPVGLLTQKCAWLQGAGRVIAIDHVAERLEKARRECQSETINFMEQDVNETLNDLTGGRGPDRCIDAVGAEAHGLGSTEAVIDRTKALVGLGTDRPTALRQAIYNCRVAGTVSVPGVYFGFLDKFPFGGLMNKGLTLKTGQTHMQKYMPDCLKLIEEGKIDPSFIITHRVSLEDAPEAYRIFKEKDDGCIKVIMTPGAEKVLST